MLRASPRSPAPIRRPKLESPTISRSPVAALRLSRLWCGTCRHRSQREGAQVRRATAEIVEAPIVMPLDVRTRGKLEQVFERITQEWGQLDFLVHSIALSPGEALQGRVIDVEREGFLTTMEVSCWSFVRKAHLAERKFRLLSRGGARPRGASGPCNLSRAARVPRSVGSSRVRRPARKGAQPCPDAHAGRHRRRRRGDGSPGARCDPPDHRRHDLRRRRLPYHRLKAPRLAPLRDAYESCSRDRVAPPACSELISRPGRATRSLELCDEPVEQR